MAVHYEGTVMPPKTAKQLADDEFFAACAEMHRALTGEDPPYPDSPHLDPDNLEPSNNEGAASSADLFYDGDPRF